MKGRTINVRGTTSRRGTKLSRGAFSSGCADLMTSSDTLALHEELGKVLRLAVCNSPFPIFNTELGHLLLTFLGRWLFSGRLFAFLTFASRLLLDLNNLRLREHFIFDFVLINVLLFLLELKSKDGLNLSDVLLNHEEFVHESEFKAIILASESVRIAEALDHDNGLIGSAELSNGLLNEANHDVKVVVHRRVLFLIKFVLTLKLTKVDSLGFLGQEQTLAPFSILLNVLLDALID
jgi:hypothetical protein